METKDNPLVDLVLRFQDGAQLGLFMDHPVAEAVAMAALGQFAGRVGTQLNITVRRQPIELVMEAIERFLDAQGELDPSASICLEQWSSREMATAILNAVLMPEQGTGAGGTVNVRHHFLYLTLEEATRRLLAACQAQHEGIDLLFARLIRDVEGFLPSKSGHPWEAIKQGNDAMALVKRIL